MGKQNEKTVDFDANILDWGDVRPKPISAVVDKEFVESHHRVTRLLLENHRSQLQRLNEAKGQIERLVQMGMGDGLLKAYEEIKTTTEGRIRTLKIAEEGFAEAEARWCSPQN